MHDLRQREIHVCRLQQWCEDNMNVVRHDTVREQIVACLVEVVHAIGHQPRNRRITQPIGAIAQIQSGVPFTKETPFLQI
jgi:hypothetical protein